VQMFLEKETLLPRINENEDVISGHSKNDENNQLIESCQVLDLEYVLVYD